MNGYIYISDEPLCPSEINPPTDAMVMIMENEVMYVSVDGYFCIMDIYPSGRSPVPLSTINCSLALTFADPSSINILLFTLTSQNHQKE